MDSQVECLKICPHKQSLVLGFTLPIGKPVSKALPIGVDGVFLVVNVTD